MLIARDESQKRPALCDLLLRKFPALRIIAVASHTNVGIFYWASYEIHSMEMGAGEQALVDLMRKDIPSGKGETK